MKKLAILIIAASSVAFAQTAAWPNHAATTSDMLDAADNVQSSLASPVTSSGTSITLTSSAPFIPYSILTVNGEEIKICSVSGTVLTVCPSGRGVGGTTAISHNPGEIIFNGISALYHKTVATELEALEATLFPLAANFSGGIISNNVLPPSLTSDTSGNAATATSLQATPNDCLAGTYPLGVDAQGNAVGCSNVYYQSLLLSGSAIGFPQRQKLNLVATGGGISIVPTDNGLDTTTFTITVAPPGGGGAGNATQFQGNNIQAGTPLNNQAYVYSTGSVRFNLTTLVASAFTDATNATNVTTGTLNASRLPGTIASNTTGSAASLAGSGAFQLTGGLGSAPSVTAGSMGTWFDLTDDQIHALDEHNNQSTMVRTFTNGVSTNCSAGNLVSGFSANGLPTCTATPGSGFVNTDTVITSQSASHSTANMVASAPGAFYTLSYYMDQRATCSAPGSGQVLATFAWTDLTGARTFATTALPFTTTTVAGGYTQGSIGIFANSGAISYSTTYTACTTGTATYDLRVLLLQMP